MRTNKSLSTELVLVGLIIMAPQGAAQTATDVDCNGCVGGRDVENHSLTGLEIRNGTLTGSDVRNGSMTGADVRNGTLSGADVRNGTLTGSDVRNSTLTGVDIRNGTLTSSDIRDGTIQARDLAPDAVFMQTRIVSPVGGDDTAANGEELLEVMAEVTATTPSETNAWSIYIEPGEYDMGSETLSIPMFVSVRGGGATNTWIRGGGDNELLNPTIALAGSTELANVSVVHPGGVRVRAIHVTGPDWIVDSVHVFGFSGSERTRGIGLVPDAGCRGRIIDSRFEVASFSGRQDAIILSGKCDPSEGDGDPSVSESVRISRVTAVASGSGDDEIYAMTTRNADAAANAQSSLFLGEISNVGTLKVISSEVNGVSNAGTIACVGAYDGDGNALNASCL